MSPLDHVSNERTSDIRVKKPSERSEWLLYSVAAPHTAPKGGRTSPTGAGSAPLPHGEWGEPEGEHPRELSDFDWNRKTQTAVATFPAFIGFSYCSIYGKNFNASAFLACTFCFSCNRNIEMKNAGIVCSVFSPVKTQLNQSMTFHHFFWYSFKVRHCLNGAIVLVFIKFVNAFRDFSQCIKNKFFKCQHRSILLVFWLYLITIWNVYVVLASFVSSCVQINSPPIFVSRGALDTWKEQF